MNNHHQATQSRLPPSTPASALPEYFRALLVRPSSRENLSHLAGSVALGMRDNVSREVAFLYLQATARHLATASRMSRSLYTSVPTAATAATAAAGGGGGSARQPDESEDLRVTKQLYEIVESGILPALASILPLESDLSESSVGFPLLSNVHVEFLQACLYAEQYQYAERMSSGTWPRPTSIVSVRNVLRYYYIRGCIHVGCTNWTMAVRCFYACLSVPGEIVSAISLAAWKKLVLVQCIIQADRMISTGAAGPLQLPKGAPKALSKFLSTATTPIKHTPGPSAVNPEDHETMHMIESEGESQPLQQVDNPSHLYGVKLYRDLVVAFVRRDRIVWDKTVNDYEALFVGDGNLGLVKQVESEFVKRQVYHYSRIYSTLPMTNLASFLNLSVPHVERLLLQLSVERVWAIEISNGVINFPKLQPRLDFDAIELMEMTKLVAKLDLAAESNGKYIAFTKKDAAAAADPKSGPRGVEDV